MTKSRNAFWLFSVSLIGLSISYSVVLVGIGLNPAPSDFLLIKITLLFTVINLFIILHNLRFTSLSLPVIYSALLILFIANIPLQSIFVANIDFKQMRYFQGDLLSGEIEYLTLIQIILSFFGLQIGLIIFGRHDANGRAKYHQKVIKPPTQILNFTIEAKFTLGLILSLITAFLAAYYWTQYEFIKSVGYERLHMRQFGTKPISIFVMEQVHALIAILLFLSTNKMRKTLKYFIIFTLPLILILLLSGRRSIAMTELVSFFCLLHYRYRFIPPKVVILGIALIGSIILNVSGEVRHKRNFEIQNPIEASLGFIRQQGASAYTVAYAVEARKNPEFNFNIVNFTADALMMLDKFVSKIASLPPKSLYEYYLSYGYSGYTISIVSSNGAESLYAGRTLGTSLIAELVMWGGRLLNFLGHVFLASGLVFVHRKLSASDSKKFLIPLIMLPEIFFLTRGSFANLLTENIISLLSLMLFTLIFVNAKK
ncbi:O-antigen polysaccharide polymerase Wzy family protein [Planktomarina temperata]|nr:O-antigen polysaccharide polymerase Wzy family protein [Planktomarina temperata]